MKRVINEKLKKEYEKMIDKGFTKSQTFKKLFEDGYEIGDISFSTKNHYSFVYGVCDSKVGVERKKENKSDVIRKMFDSGKKVGEISKELNSNYSYVFGVVKKYKESKEVI